MTSVLQKLRQTPPPPTLLCRSGLCRPCFLKRRCLSEHILNVLCLAVAPHPLWPRTRLEGRAPTDVCRRLLGWLVCQHFPLVKLQPLCIQESAPPPAVGRLTLYLRPRSVFLTRCWINVFLFHHPLCTALFHCCIFRHLPYN